VPRLLLLVASGAAQRRLLRGTLEDLEKKGFPTGSRMEGGQWLPLLSENRGGGLFDVRRALVVEEAEGLGPFPAAGLALLEGEEAPVALVCVYREEPGKYLPPEALKRCALIRAEEVPRFGAARMNWIRSVAREARVDLTGDGLALLAELLEDPEEIRGELEKLRLASVGGRVDAERVAALCLDDGGRDFFRLLDGLCARDIPRALGAAEALRGRGEPVIPCVSGLYGRMRLAWHASAFPPRESSRLCSALGAGFHAWKTALQAVRIYPPQAIRRFCRDLIRLNAMEKVGRGAGWGELQRAMLAFFEAAVPASRE
jgi:DNA polymerase-3 subunit delta